MLDYYCCYLQENINTYKKINEEAAQKKRGFFALIAFVDLNRVEGH